MLDEATMAASGGKAATLATLRHAGIDVPDGFVIPFSEYRRHHALASATGMPPTPALIHAIDEQLRRLFNGSPDGGHVAVRSSANCEDGRAASAAGQYDTLLGLCGTDDVSTAVARCWGSLHSDRATAYRDKAGGEGTPAMAVLIQRMIDPDVSGVMFTGTPCVIEATPGLGEPLVSGQITPDAWTIDDHGICRRRRGSDTHRLDRHGHSLVTAVLPAGGSMCLADEQVLALDRHGRRIAEMLGHPVDLEWAVGGNRIHTLQARPITAHPSLVLDGNQGLPASPGRATGVARVVLGPQDFSRFRTGDILVCRDTDPAWTPLFRYAAGVITETGGTLSHAAIVAREVGIPAVLSVPDATTHYVDGTCITIDGTIGRIETES